MEMDYPVGMYLSKNLPIIKRMAIAIKKQEYKNLVLVATGSSGAIIAAIIANEFDVSPPIMYIHKKNEDSHHHPSDKYNTDNSFVFVDDFVRTGETVRYVNTRMKEKGLGNLTAICLSCYSITCAKKSRKVKGICKDWIFVK